MVRALPLLALLAGCEAGVIGGGTVDAPANGDASTTDAPPPTPSGCVDDVSTGDHVYTCEGLQVDARIPAACQAPGCGLILELHGDTGTGLLMDGHTKLRDLGDQHGYIVVAPTGPPWQGVGPGSTWSSDDDAKLVAITERFAGVFRVDPTKIHVTGFSRGGFVTWRLLCDHSDLFASAAPAGAGNGQNFGETTCFEDSTHVPARKLPILFLMGRTDVSVQYTKLVEIRDDAIAAYSATGPSHLDGNADYSHDRWSGQGLIEVFDHAYETVSDGPFASAQGHCIVGSTSDPYASQYAIPCELPNAFVWGEQVIAFFMAHPKS